MKNVFKVLLLMSIVLFSACESEQKRSNSATGKLAIQLAASSDVINTTTRTGDSGENEGENTEEDDLVPDVGDFTIALMDGNVVKTSWDKFSEYPKYAVLPVGAYVLKAYYGNSDEEGFESPYYEGTQEITVEDDATVDAYITCYLTNVKVSVEYTDAFKKYFSDYSTTVQSVGGKSINFAKDEVRAAYVKPGDLTIYANVKKQNGQSAKLNILDIEDAKSREFYRFKLDVDAGSATLKISFDNTTVDKPVEINISDEILNMQPPFFTRSGYESEVMQEVIEGGVISPLSMLITARNGIKKCVLNTQSTSLIAQGWPVSIDLVNVKEEDLQKMNALGLAMRGLSTNVDKMATLDFSEVIPYLQYISGDDESSFSLIVTDKIGRVNETEEVIKVKTLDNQFAVGTVDNVDLGVYEVTVPVTLKGDKERIKFQYLNGEVWTDISVSNIVTEEDINHKVTLALPFMTTNNFEVKVAYGARSYLVPIGVNPPIFTVAASEADVWATKASITLIGVNEGTNEYLKTQSVVIEYVESAKIDEGNWITPAQTKDGNVIEITGLPADAEKENTYKVKAVLGDVESTNILDITTEIAAQVPNSGFEEWYFTTESKKWILTTYYWYTYFPYVDGETDLWWTTNNARSTEWPRVGGIAYPVSYSSTSAVSYLSETYSEGDNRCAEIRSMGSGSGYANTSFICYEGSRIPGRLFIGKYNWDGNSETITYGHSFSSRPSALDLWYKYIPYGTDEFEIKMEVFNKDGDKETLLGSTIYRVSKSEATEWSRISIPVEYGNLDLKATHFYISFLSSTKEYPDVETDTSMILEGVSNNWKAHVGSRLRIDDVKLIY